MTREQYKVLSMASGMKYMVSLPPMMNEQEDLRDLGLLEWSHDHPDHHRIIAYKITQAGKGALAKGPPSQQPADRTMMARTDTPNSTPS